MKKILSVFLALAVFLLAAQAAVAEKADPVKGVFDALTAEDSDYSKNKAAFRVSFPNAQYEEKLEGDRITISLSGSGDYDGTWVFALEGDCLTLTAKEEDFNAYLRALEVLRAAGDYYGVNNTLLNAYLSGLDALGMDNPYFKREIDEATGMMKVSIRITGPYDMPELDKMVMTADALNLYGFEPMTENNTSQAANLGKVSAVINGNRDGATFLIMEYGELDDIAFQDLTILVKTLQPAGWEAFAAGYTELKDAAEAEYTVTLNADRAAVQEIIDDPPEGYSFIIARIGTEASGAADAGEGADAAAGTDGGETAAEAAANIQYILFLGTNDKDTNKPVFTQAESMERAKDILIRHFGGYTIQEASGGWIDGDIHYQEYTLVIYLSDTTPEAVHAAADELVETFRQSSVLIEAIPTTTEFYFPAH